MFLYPFVDIAPPVTKIQEQVIVLANKQENKSNTRIKIANKLLVINTAKTKPTRSSNALTRQDSKLSFNYFINNFVKHEIKKNVFSFPIRDLSQLIDPKTKAIPVIYIPLGTSRESAAEIKEIKVKILPALNLIEPNSLLWLPYPYIIAGSFHKEMYPNDTSVVIWDLLESARTKNSELAKDYLGIIQNQLENFAFQIKHFGFPLNGNRGYFITRSQTNIIPTNVLQYYKVTGDKKWLAEKGLRVAEEVFNYWTSKEAEIKTPFGTTYKWIAYGKGPCLEVIDSHKAHDFYYFKVLKTLIEYLKMEDANRLLYAKGFNYSEVVEVIPDSKINLYKKQEKLKKELINLDDKVEAFILDKSVSNYDAGEPVIKYENTFYKLTGQYYLNDRASRVSGYDTNHLYGPFNSFTYDFIPADHNILLYEQAKDIAELHKTLGNFKEADEYYKKADDLKKLITKLLWDEKSGMFFEYNFKTKKLRTDYPFAGSAYALFAYIFDVNIPNEKERLIKLVNYIENNLEGPSGIYASGIETGLHWDKPYIWPVQVGYIVGGLRDYARELQDAEDYKSSNHLTQAADRIAIKYLLANYSDWLGSKGKKIGEKVAEGNENLFTGYKTGSNYTWNLSTVLYLYSTLSEKGRKNLDLELFSVKDG